MKFTARIMLIDCGQATKITRGVSSGFTEAGSPPHNHFS
jgi:hypothetical protein